MARNNIIMKNDTQIIAYAMVLARSRGALVKAVKHQGLVINQREKKVNDIHIRQK